jgi:hypothetical protein
MIELYGWERIYIEDLKNLGVSNPTKMDFGLMWFTKEGIVIEVYSRQGVITKIWN